MLWSDFTNLSSVLETFLLALTRLLSHPSEWKLWLEKDRSCSTWSSRHNRGTRKFLAFLWHRQFSGQVQWAQTISMQGTKQRTLYTVFHTFLYRARCADQPVITKISEVAELINSHPAKWATKPTAKAHTNDPTCNRLSCICAYVCVCARRHRCVRTQLC